MTFSEKWKKSKLYAFVKPLCTPFGLISLIVLLCYAISLLFPLIWAVVTSFREPTTFLLDRYMGYGLWPQDWSDSQTWFNNYATVFDTFGIKIFEADGTPRVIGLAEMIGNSVLYAVGSTVMGVLACLLMAYAVAMFKFKSNGVIYTVVIIQMVLPIVGSAPSEIRVAEALNFYDNMIGMWIMKTYVSGLYFLIFYSAFQLIPKDYAEAARLDGAGNFTIMVKIMFPFVKGSIFSIALLKFIGLWNDYQTPLLYMPTHPTFAYGVYKFTRGSVTGDTPTQLAAAMVMAIPLFVVFIAFQKKLLGDLSVGGLK